MAQTKATIRAAVVTPINNSSKGENEALTDAEAIALTDACASALETVNPNHDYPPTPR